MPARPQGYDAEAQDPVEDCPVEQKGLKTWHWIVIAVGATLGVALLVWLCLPKVKSTKTHSSSHAVNGQKLIKEEFDGCQKKQTQDQSVQTQDQSEPVANRSPVASEPTARQQIPTASEPTPEQQALANSEPTNKEAEADVRKLLQQYKTVIGRGMTRDYVENKNEITVNGKPTNVTKPRRVKAFWVHFKNPDPKQGPTKVYVSRKVYNLLGQKRFMTLNSFESLLKEWDAEEEESAEPSTCTKISKALCCVLISLFVWRCGRAFMDYDQWDHPESDGWFNWMWHILPGLTTPSEHGEGVF